MSSLPRQVIADRGIGASEIAAALGLNPYKTPLDLWLEKTGQRPGFAGNERTEWGLDVEPALREWYVRRSQAAVWVPPGSLFHVQIPWMRATPDGISLVEDRGGSLEDFEDRAAWARGFEAKNVGWRSAHRWGEPGSDEVPIEYLLQAQQGMAVTGLAEWDVVASIGGAPPEVYQVARDEDLIAELVEGGTRFMRQVEAGQPPGIDGSAAWSDYLAERYPNTVEDYLEADDELEVVIAALQEVRTMRVAQEDAEAELANRIKAAIGPRAGVQSKLGRITWRPAKAREVTDWKTIAEQLADKLGADAGGISLEPWIKLHTKQAKPSRPFNCPRSWATSG